MIHLWLDLALAWRDLRRRPGITAAIVITLALAVGVNAATYAVVRAVLFGALPLGEPEQLAALYTVDPGNPGHMPVSAPTALDARVALRDAGTAELALSTSVPTTIELDGGPVRANTMIVTANYFDVLRLPLALGRGFDHDDRGPEVAEVVLGDALWRKHFGGSPDAIGRVLRVESQPLRIVGIAPPGFDGTSMRDAQLFVPYSTHATVLPSLPWFDERRYLAFEAIVRMGPDGTLEQLQTELDAIGESVAAAHPAAVGARRLRAVPLSHALVGPDARAQVVLAATLGLLAVGFVLVVACANAANLLLARASPLQTELALRVALGATPLRLVRQIACSAAMLATAAGALGLAAAPWLRDGMWSLRPPLLQRIAVPPPIDLAVLGYGALLTLVTALLFGVAPAWRAARVDLSGSLRHHAGHGQRTHRGLRSALVVVQVAVSYCGLLAAALFVRSAEHGSRVDPGFAVRDVAVAELDIGGTAGNPSLDFARLDAWLAAMRRRDDVAAVAVATHLPFGHSEFRRTVSADAVDGVTIGAPRLVPTSAITPELLPALDIELRQGRGFDARDDVDAPMVAIVSEAFARTWWSDGVAIGRQIRFAGVPSPIEVVGVAETIKVMSPTEADAPFVWVPLWQWPQPSLDLVVRMRPDDDDDDGELGVASLRGRLAEVPGITAARVHALADDVDAALAPTVVAARLLGLFGGLAVLLSAIGMHAVMTDAVRQQTREIGIRMALGATPRHVRAMILRDALGLTSIGVVAGIGGGLLLQQRLADHLYEVAAGDVVAFGTVALLVTASALLATWFPARAATRVEPARAIDRGRA
ncbi:MAG: ABC transporter permease [Nannocystaceae bacterium]|nr:ABC transporter permease [Nannocystaceae bacterium]